MPGLLLRGSWDKLNVTTPEDGSVSPKQVCETVEDTTQAISRKRLRLSLSRPKEDHLTEEHSFDAIDFWALEESPFKKRKANELFISGDLKTETNLNLHPVGDESITFLTGSDSDGCDAANSSLIRIQPSKQNETTVITVHVQQNKEPTITSVTPTYNKKPSVQRNYLTNCDSKHIYWNKQTVTTRHVRRTITSSNGKPINKNKQSVIKRSVELKEESAILSYDTYQNQQSIIKRKKIPPPPLFNEVHPCTNPDSLVDNIAVINLEESLSAPNSNQGKNINKKTKKGSKKILPRVWPSRRSQRLLKAKKKKMNGYGTCDGQKSSTDESPSSDHINYPPIATLANLGNTCFLNSVLYTLRFTPNFVHSLHHLSVELCETRNKQAQNKSKTSSLGRNSSAGKTWTSTKEMLCITPTIVESLKTKLQTTTQKLHLLFESMHSSEVSESCEPFKAEEYLTSLREVNSYFDGNQQHDAHELLVCLLNNVHETFVELEKMKAEVHDGTLSKEPEVPVANPPPINASKSWVGVRKSWKRKKDKSVACDVADAKISADESGRMKVPDSDNQDGMNGITVQTPLAAIDEDSHSSSVTEESCPSPKGPDAQVESFIVNDFQGVTVLNTTCLECECSSLRKEVFRDIGICVPTERKEDDTSSDNNVSLKTINEVYESAIVTTEYLRDLNKYWCTTCTRYNEAKRSVQYETLPKILVLQLKRFASNIHSMMKINDYMPTPLTLACFCTQCSLLPEDKRLHKYELYGVIMHLGQAIASGHYVTYVKATENITSYLHCLRDKNKSSSLSASTSKSGNCDKMGGFFRFFKPKSNPESSAKLVNSCNQAHSYTDSCRGLDCCGVRLNGLLVDQIENGTLPSRRKDKENSCVEVPEPVWLECDDENVRPLTVKEFQDLLGPTPGLHSGQTPYLLFFSRC